MSLYKRGNTWWVDVTTASGQRVRESTETSNRKAAQEYHDKLKAETWRVDRLGERPGGRGMKQPGGFWTSPKARPA